MLKCYPRATCSTRARLEYLVPIFWLWAGFIRKSRCETSPNTFRAYALPLSTFEYGMFAMWYQPWGNKAPFGSWFNRPWHRHNSPTVGR